MSYMERTVPAPPKFLPFKLQHDFLTVIQKLLEEACFYFAQKWVPEALVDQQWSTPEQGELTAWWQVLSRRVVPRDAIHFPITGPAALFTRVRQIRNNAVHRQPVPILVVHGMVRDALLLASGLKDVFREAKLRKMLKCLESKNLDALRLSIDEPLGNFETIQDQHLALSQHGSNRTYPANGLGSGVTTTVATSTAFSRSNFLPQVSGQDGEPKTLNTVTDSEADNEISSWATTLPLPVVCASSISANTIEGQSINQRMVIDLTQDDVIDLTQDSDKENTVELRQYAVVPEQSNFPLIGRVMAPGKRRMRKEKLRERRQRKIANKATKTRKAAAKAA